MTATNPSGLRTIKSEMEAKQEQEGGEHADEDCPHVVGNAFKVMRKEGRQGGLLPRLFKKR